jgi:uncharacterized protein (DUF427 family)
MPNPAPGFASKPTHRVDLAPEPRRVRVVFAGIVIADSAQTLRVEETGHEPVHYFPEKDVRTDLLRATQHTTHCPFKGDAAYWTIVTGEGGETRQAENAVWGYPRPFDETAGLAGHYAFYKSRVDSVTVA